MIDFLKYRWVALVVSSLYVGGFFVAYFYRSYSGQEPLKYSVDFTGGTVVHFKTDKPVTASQITPILDSEPKWKGATIREFPADKTFLVRVQAAESDARGLAVHMQEALSKGIPGTTFTITQSESVGQSIGAALRDRSILAIILGLIAMLIYIVVRFWSFGFALGAVLALFHDAISILCVFMIFGLEISVSVIMAILAILGYSINDTIVIFTKIRKNLPIMRSSSLYDIVNISINQMLRRTILTSFATSLTVLSLLLLGGETLRNLSIALMTGIVFGTYSSVYIASAIMILIYKRQE